MRDHQNEGVGHVGRGRNDPLTMNGLVLLGPDQFEVREMAVPKPGRHEVLCEVHSVAICGTDKEIISGNLATKAGHRATPTRPATNGRELWSRLAKGRLSWDSRQEIVSLAQLTTDVAIAVCVQSAATTCVTTMATRSSVITTTVIIRPARCGNITIRRSRAFQDSRVYDP